MSIIASCPHCTAPTSFEPPREGETVKCSGCGEYFPLFNQDTVSERTFLELRAITRTLVYILAVLVVLVVVVLFAGFWPRP